MQFWLHTGYLDTSDIVQDAALQMLGRIQRDRTLVSPLAV
jgi:hypothetical protein